MDLLQMHERLRLELLRRIQRGTLSVSLLARQTGFGQPHLSNFLHSRRQLSLDAMDRVLAAQHMTAADLLPAQPRLRTEVDEGGSSVPVVSHHAALFEPYIRPAAVQETLHLPPRTLERIRTRVSPARRKWERFVAVRVPASDAVAMEPLVLPEALALIDRHAHVIGVRVSAGASANRPYLYAVGVEERLTLRYVEVKPGRLVLRPLNGAYPVELLEIELGQSAADFIVGRVALVLNEV
jgi:hypothetical protein